MKDEYHLFLILFPPQGTKQAEQAETYLAIVSSGIIIPNIFPTNLSWAILHTEKLILENF